MINKISDKKNNLDILDISIKIKTKTGFKMVKALKLPCHLIYKYTHIAALSLTSSGSKNSGTPFFTLQDKYKLYNSNKSEKSISMKTESSFVYNKTINRFGGPSSESFCSSDIDFITF